MFSSLARFRRWRGTSYPHARSLVNRSASADAIRAAEAPRVADARDLPPARIPLDVAVLEDRTLYSASPMVLDPLQVFVDENATRAEVDLDQLFSVDNTGSGSFQIVGTPLSQLGGNASVDDQHQLVLEFPEGQVGSTKFTVRGTNASGRVESLAVELIVREVNDAPTSGDLRDFTSVGDTQTVIDLFGAFDDEEDADRDLTFRLAGNTRPELFSSVEWDLERGQLILHHAEDAVGTAELTITATDRGGLSVGAGTAEGFHVFDQIGGTPGVNSPDTRGLGLSQLSLWTSWFFFDYTRGTYDYSELAVSRFLAALEAVPASEAEIPIVFDIENDFYVNTPVGRDRFAEVFSLAQQTRPDLNFGLYMYAPERAWYEPVYMERTLAHQEMGVNSWYTLNADKVEQNYEAWLARNELYRTAPVSPEYGGVPLADMMDTINVSLYTVMRNNAYDEPHWREISLDADANRLAWDGPELRESQVMRLRLSPDGQFGNGLSQWVDYYAVNVTEDSFQISATRNGAAIDFSANVTGKVFAGVKGPWENIWHDPSVIDWHLYAEQNVAEGRKFGKPVYAWISPSMYGAGEQHLDQEFFRLQLETLKPLVDGIVIFESAGRSATYHENQGWWAAVRDFMGTLDDGPAKVTIEVGSHLPPPEGQADEIAVVEDQARVFGPGLVLGNDVSGTGKPLVMELVAGPQHGVLEELSGGRWRYTPDANFHGSDTWSYRAFDGARFTEPVQVTMQVASVNDLPVALDDVAWMQEDGVLRLPVSQLLANDGDADGDSLRWELVSGPTHGTLVELQDGTLQYTPVGNFAGSDEILYRVSDGQDVSATARLRLEVVGVNDRPVAGNDLVLSLAGRTQEVMLSSLLANDVDAEGDPLAIRWVEQPAGGRVRDLGDGRWAYTPRLGFAGTDTLYYVVSDGSLESEVAQVTIQVLNATQSVAAVPVQGLLEDTSQRFSLEQLAGRAGLSTTRDGFAELKLSVTQGPRYGSLSRGLDGELVYTPNRNWHGDDSFRYRFEEGADQSREVSVGLQVAAVNDAPEARGDVYRITRNATLRVNGAGVLANDLDVDGDKLSLELVSGPRNGSLVWSGDGSFSYRAQNGFSGVDSFRYRVFDDQGGESLADVQLRVGMPAGATAASGTATAASSSPVSGWPPTQADLRAALSTNSGATAGGSGFAATTASSLSRNPSISTGLGSDSSSQLSGSRSITRTVRRR